MKFDFLRVMRERNSLIAAPGNISGTCNCNALVHCTACSNVEVDGKAECSFTEIQRCVNSVFSFMKELKLQVDSNSFRSWVNASLQLVKHFTCCKSKLDIFVQRKLWKVCKKELEFMKFLSCKKKTKEKTFRELWAYCRQTFSLRYHTNIILLKSLVLTKIRDTLVW